MCSAASATRDVIIKKSSKSEHLRTSKHKNSVQHLSSVLEGEDVQQSSTCAQDLPNARLTLAQEFMDMDIDSDLPDESPQDRTDPFSLVTQDSDHFYDEDNEQIIFTAGLEENVEIENSHKRIWDEINALNYFHHEILSQTSSAAKTFPDSEGVDNDSTVTRVIAEMQALSKLSITYLSSTLVTDRPLGLDDVDSDDEEDTHLDMSTQGNKDPAWYPHGSKMVSLELEH